MKNVLKSILGTFKKPKEQKVIPVIYLEQTEEVIQEEQKEEVISIKNNNTMSYEKYLKKYKPVIYKQIQLIKIARRTKSRRIKTKLLKRITNLYGPY